MIALPPVLRPSATLGLLDITKFYGPATGGIRTYLNAKAAWTAAHPGIRHALVVPAVADAVDDAGGVRWYRLRGPRIPGARSYRALAAPRAIAAIVAHERPDVIEVGSHFLVPWQVFRANRRLGARVVWFAHTDLAGLAGRGWGRGLGPREWRSAMGERYVRALARRVDLVIAGSNGHADRLREAGAPRVAVAPLGVDLRRCHPGRRERQAAVRLRHGLREAPYAIYAGRIAREKELDVVLAAWPEVERRTGVGLVLMGAGADAARLRRLPGAARASWLPFDPDPEPVADLLAGAEFFVAPGPHETFGLAAAEAAGCGAPVLTVDRGAVGERVAASGTGAVYRRGDAAGLVEGAVSLVAGGMPLRRRVRDFAERHLGWDAAFDRLLALYRDLAPQ
ncbi:MAG TPA: glycosyltransferase [Gemmatimonadales bacterium]|nr:glycosyltransferase [Gemmatimonadales bacterium]